jgi:hypothetical protein
MCPNSSNGEHNYQLQAIISQGETIIVKVCLLCASEG